MRGVRSTAQTQSGLTKVVHPANADIGAGVAYDATDGSFEFTGSGTSYVSLPLTVVGGGLPLSVATWVQPTTCTADARIVDFGQGSAIRCYGRAFAFLARTLKALLFVQRACLPSSR